jgi:acylaminoacyl-peptidase
MSTSKSTAGSPENPSHNMATMDTQDFHQFAAAAVELSNARVLLASSSTVADGSSSILSVERSVRDWDNDCRKSYLYHIPIPKDDSSDGDDDDSNHIPPTLVDSSVVARIVSPSGKKTLVLKKNIQTKKATILEIWHGGSMTRRIDTTTNNGHGSIICNDVTFGSPSWSSDETCLVYSAERPTLKTSSYWSSAEDTSSKEKDNNRVNENRGAQNVLGQGVAEDWGERYPDQDPLLDVYILNTTTARIQRVPFLQDEHYNSQSNLGSVSLGQVVFAPTTTGTNKKKIALTCFDAGGMGMSRRLGMVFCRNRPSQVYEVEIGELLERLAVSSSSSSLSSSSEKEDKEIVSCPCTCISSDFALARSPRYVPGRFNDNEEAALVFLGHKQGFASHDGCMGLYAKIDDDDNDNDNGDSNTNIKEVIPPMEHPLAEGPKVPTLGDGIGFPGIFTGDLPLPCAIPGTNTLLMGTLWGSMGRLLQVDINTGHWNLVDFAESHPLASHSLLCQTDTTTSASTTASKKDVVELVVSETTSNSPAKLWKLSFPKTTEISETGVVTAKATHVADFGSIACTDYSPVEAKFEPPFDVELVSLDNPKIQALVLLPRSSSTATTKVPLIVVPHGGPHSASTSSYVPGFAFLASRCAVVLPNYRGSIGFGQGPLTSLLTNIGRNDVDDVMACTRQVLEQFSDRVDANRGVAICGGSHGGFLTAHCTSQYPTFFRAAITRNPVTNIASMVTATDIPDWCHAECLGRTLDNGATFRGPTKEELTSMYDKSPIQNVDKVQTPTLVALGLLDLRVPPSQGKEWYYSLRSQGVPTELLVYPKDNHSLSLVGTEADHWIRIMRWLRIHLPLE